MYDIAVIGGGPAGLSAAIQARARNKSVLVVSGDDRDNPLYKTSRIDNYLGFYNVTGPELLERFRTHAGQMGVERRDGRVLNLLAAGGAYYLSIGSEVEQARAVVLATGVVRAKKYPGEAERLGAGVSYCATCDGMLYRGREIAVVGKTADAPHEANYLRELGCRVTYVSDRPPEGLHSDIPFVKAVRLEVLGEKKVEALRADSVTLPCEGVFILRPSMAPADLLPGLALEGGYIKTDRNMATNLPGVFAAGDCTGLPLQVSKAVGEGQVAGHRASVYVDTLKFIITRYRERTQQIMALIHLTNEAFDKATASGLAMVDFWATWCGPCKMLSPVIDGLADRYEGKVLVGKVNTDEQPELAIRFGVMSIPTVIFLKDGKEIDRKVGVMPEASYTAVLDANL